MDLTELRYLEGKAALTGRIATLSQRSPNGLQVAFASSCLLHGRLFWESARTAPLETKPLLLYYGAAAFAKALIVATGTRVEDLSQSHGLSCATGAGERIANFAIRARGVGLFQEFNDAVAPRNSFFYYENTMSRKLPYPTASSSALSNFKVTLDDCFARLPDLTRIYELSTGFTARTLTISVMDTSDGFSTHTIRVDIPQLYDNADGLHSIVNAVRNRAPFLAGWRLKEASKNWDNTILIFDNYIPDDNENYILASQDGSYITQRRNHQTFDAMASLPPLTGGKSGLTSFMQPIDGQSVSEHSVTLAALLGLSSLVRYHPHTWTACIYRRQISSRPIDDGLLPVIEEFLALVESKFPRLVAEILL